jgi:SpoVK/Ycf46/Vps4 family AAA+-type ATPase
MTASTGNGWHEANMLYLTARLAAVRERLSALCSEQPATNESEMAEGHEHDASLADAIERSASEAASAMTSPPALDELCSGFELSPFEHDVLLMCAGMELEPDFPHLCAAAQRSAQMNYPTFRLALAALPDTHWSALIPIGKLRHWRLIELDGGSSLTSSPLRIDERVLHYLVGISYLDERLRNFIELVPVPASLPASYRTHAERILNLWMQTPEERLTIQLSGDARGSRRMLAAAGCAALNLRLHALSAGNIPATSTERETLIRLWQREALLTRSALLLECDEGDDAASLRNAQSFAERVGGLLFVTGNALSADARQSVARVEINRPAADEQRALWEVALGPLAGRLNGQLDEVISQFQFDSHVIRAAGRAVRELASESEPEKVGPILWQVCREQSRASLDGLAECIKTRAQWEDLVLPEEQSHTLGEIAAQVRQRMKVYETWGFAARNVRGLGISALFSGPSGTGKTLAAEVLAGSLQLDLYRIDLSQIVSKYIGETEKNLRSVFDAAEQSGAVLLFDEADALFGKRSEVRDSHDRYANIEVSYLLQRMEAYRGLAILTTNLRNSLDTAFLRRIRFVVSFPFPDANLRAKIWEHIFPPDTPTQGLDLNKLARLNVTGGNIRNIALNAAFLAADEGEPVRMNHLLRTARSECAKMEKPVTNTEVGGWI